MKQQALKEASVAQYHAMGKAIIDGMQKGWDYRSAAEFLLKDSPSLSEKTARYSTGKLRAMVAFESRWYDSVLKLWFRAGDHASDERMTAEQYGREVIRTMVAMQPVSFHKDS